MESMPVFGATVEEIVEITAEMENCGPGLRFRAEKTRGNGADGGEMNLVSRSCGFYSPCSGPTFSFFIFRAL
jgi:hypothetical protein